MAGSCPFVLTKQRPSRCHILVPGTSETCLRHPDTVQSVGLLDHRESAARLYEWKHRFS